MGDPISAAIGAGAQIIGGLVGGANTNKQNFNSRQFSREMYDRTKTDNLSFWNMQNEYNSPQAQMKRMQDAGLNKNLPFMSGGSSGGGTAGSIPTPSVQSGQFKTNEVGQSIGNAGLSFMNAIYDLDIKGAQADNLKAQNGVIEQDLALRTAQAGRTNFDLDFDKEMRSVSADARRESLRQVKTSTDLSMNKDVREQLMNASNLKEAAERMLNYKVGREKTGFEISQIDAETKRIYQGIKLMKQDGTLKRMDIELRKMGINPNDPTWTRVVGRALNSMFEYFSKEGNSKPNNWSLLEWLTK